MLRDVWTMAYTLRWLAHVAATRQHGVRADRLLSAAEVLREAAGSMIQFSPTASSTRSRLPRCVLSSAKRLWLHAGRRGAVTLDHAIAYALEETDKPREGTRQEDCGTLGGA